MKNYRKSKFRLQNIFFLLIIIFVIEPIDAQFLFRAGMGIDFASTPSLNDYINQNFPIQGNPLGSFNSAIVFSGEAGYMVSEQYMLSIDLGYLINSYTAVSDLGQYEFSYNIISPSLLIYYVISGEGYNFRLGGGPGFRSINAELKLPGALNLLNYNSTGFGIILRADGNTLLGGNVYANIGADLKYDFNGDLKNDDYLINNTSGKNVNINSLSVGIRLGITYFF